MKRLALLSALFALASVGPVVAAPRAAFTLRQLEVARTVRDSALRDEVGYALVRSLTSEVGPRPAGSEGDARAVAWALEHMRAIGLQNVHAEPVRVPHWVRGECRVETVSPWPQTLAACALGGSVATPPGGLEAEVVRLGSLDEFSRGDSTRFAGRIVFLDVRMPRREDGSGYGQTVPIRGRGAIEAGRRGALAVVIRSVGTDNDRLPHTGAMRYEAGVPRIPAVAVSNPDADLLRDQLASGRAVRLRLTNTSSWADSTLSANVVGEVPGRERPDEAVVLGAHLDSWDLGTGAHDDATGCGIMMAAARRIALAPERPRRTVRVVLFANEEHGLQGARGYAAAHLAEVDRIVFGMESDLGAFRPMGFRSRVQPDRLAAVRDMHRVIAPLGVAWRGNDATGDADVGRLADIGVPVGDLDTDASRYFDLHHTANDTFDKVDPAMVRLNVACYAALAWLAADLEAGLSRIPRAGTPR